MNRARNFLIIEGIILLLLAMKLFTSRPGFIPAIVIAVVFSALAANARNNNTTARSVFGCVGGVAWLFIIVYVLTTGFFWLALIWPVIWLAAFYRRAGASDTPENARPRARAHARKNEPRDITNEATDTSVSADKSEATLLSRDDVLDLATLDFHASGNQLTIKKAAGNTTIRVPEEVAIRLNISTANGLIRIFENPPVLDGHDIRFQSDAFESAEKRVTIVVSVDTGNIEVMHA
ncbi:MAG: LiaF-related protein [Streptococcaceae bacterium]|jgi:predicted membrane protein|nr:LiaF-related protein [Streptococcaceae bacterium]